MRIDDIEEIVEAALIDEEVPVRIRSLILDKIHDILCDELDEECE
jgi:hypothetical protein